MVAAVAPRTNAIADIAPRRRRPLVPALILLVGLALGLGVRLHGLDASPLGFHPARQYRSALIARAMYLDRTLPATAPARVQADAAARLQGTLEPEVMEEAASVGYQVLGHEALWVPRLLSALLWLLAAVGVFQLLRRMVGLVGQAAGLLAFVLLPLGVEGGRSFQPDALMVTLMVWSLLAMVRHDEAPSRRRLVLAALLVAAAVVVKPMAVPMLAFGFLALQRRRLGSWRRIVNRDSILFAVIAVAPAALYYAVGFAGGSTYFVASLLSRASFYRNWFRIMDFAIGVPVIAAALAGTLLAPRRWRPFLAALWLGYVAFGLVVDYRIETHTYYHLQLVLVVALGVGLLADRVSAMPLIRAPGLARIAVAISACVLLAAFVYGALQGQPTTLRVDSATPAVDRTIGDVVGHDPRVLTVTADYGTSLQYYGGVVGTEYPSPSDVALQRLSGGPVASVSAAVNTPINGAPARWLAVTDWPTWEALPALRAWATAHAHLVAQGPSWAVYRLND